MMRILIGYYDPPLTDYDTDRYEVRCVRYRADGQGPPATIAEMLAQCPPDWKPDVYYHMGLVFNPIPADIEAFAGLTVTDVQDWHRGGRAVWAGAGFFDLVLAERRAGQILNASSYENTQFVRLWGVDPKLHRVLPDVEKDIDILFIGSLNSSVWEERNLWLDRLAKLSDRYRVVITAGHFDEAYIQLTNRTKIVFNRSVNGCTNQRAYDASVCGALVFNETENEETREIFEDGVHCVYYNSENLEALLDYYLTHDAERERIVAAGRQKALAEHTLRAHTDALLAAIEANLDKAGYRPYARRPRAERDVRKAFQIYGSLLPAGAEEALALLDTAAQEGYEQGRLLEARAALHGWVAHYLPDAQAKVPLLAQAIEYARQAAEALPHNAVAQMTLAFLLLERAEITQGMPPSGESDLAEAATALTNAAEMAEAGLAAEDTTGSTDVEGFGYPHWRDEFDNHIERIFLRRDVDEVTWARERRAAIAWKCRSMLSDLALAAGDLAGAYPQAERAVQDLPTEPEAYLRLARCEAMSGHLEAAVTHYRAGFARTPLAYDSWPELAETLVALGRHDEAQQFVAERLRVIAAMPGLRAIRPALLKAIET